MSSSRVWAPRVLLLLLVCGVAVLSSTRASATGAQASPLHAVPPAGGVTHTIADGADAATLLQSIPFEADALFIFDVASQRWRTYSPNSPTWLNESFAEHLSSGAVVWVRRDPGDQRGGITWPAANAPSSVAHAQTLAVPPAGGATAGVAGTSSVAALLGVQSFEVRGVFAFDVEQQRYLTYSPGVPAWANSLPEDGLRADGIVWLSRESNRSSGGVPMTGASIIRHVTYEDDQPMMTSDQAPPNGVGRQTDAVRAGSSAGYAIVRPGDPRSHAGGFRSEWHGSDHTGDGTERWYGISYYLPSDYHQGSNSRTFDDRIIFQFADQGSPMFSLHLDAEEQEFWVRRKHPQRNSAGNPVFETLARWSVNTGQWYDIVFHAEWSTNNSGRFEVYVDGQRRVNFEGRTLAERNQTYSKWGVYGQPTKLYFDEVWTAEGSGTLESTRP